jgi:hypothetical protein
MSLPAFLIIATLILVPLAAAGVLLGAAWRKLLRLRRQRDDAKRAWVERAWAWGPALGVVLLSAGAVAYAREIEPRRVGVTRVEIRAGRPVGAGPRYRIVHLSDLHFDRTGERERRVLEIVRAAKPDLVLLTGDYLNVRGAAADLVGFLGELKAAARHGVYGVGGNWDGKFPIAELFESAGAVWLRDDYALVRTGGARDVLLVGLDWHPSRPARELFAGASADSYKILLHHSPDAVDELAGTPADLFLCGHTHGGQVRLPGWGALITMTRLNKRYEMGRYRVEPPATGNPRGTDMFVSRGVGMSGIGPRLRFLCPPEVAVIELVGD